MAEITFFATDDDWNGLWRFLFDDLGLTAFPDNWFGDLPAPTLTSNDDVIANLAAYPRVAPALAYTLTSDDWSTEPIRYDRCSANPNFAPFWYVLPRHGGPAINCLPAYGYPWWKSPGEIVAGKFFDYPSYYSTAARAGDMIVIDRPDGLASAMRSIRRELRSKGKIVRTSSGKRAIAFGNALAEHQQGKTLRQGDLVFALAK